MFRRRALIFTSKSGRLPSGYQEVEYIESTGTQYIDTGFVPNQTQYKYNWEFAFTEILTDGVYNRVFGNFIDDNTVCSRFQYRISGNNLYYPVNAKIPFGSGVNGNALSIDTFYPCELDTTKLKIGSQTLNIAANTDGNANTTDIALFGSSTSGTSLSKLKLKYFKISDLQGNLLRNFIPCYRKSDNVIGMYDTVTETFFTNAGTGTFTKGNDYIW